MKLPTIMTHDGRRAWSFAAIVGGSMVFTVIIIWLICLLRDHPEYLANLAYLAHVQVLVGMSALGWQMGRRLMASAGRDGVTINDSGNVEIHQGGTNEPDHVIQRSEPSP